MKVFLHWCFENNYLQQFSLKPFVTRTEDIQSVYLTKSELDKIKNCHLNQDQAIVRDLFVIGCETGLRFSDFAQLKSSQINEELLHVYPKKTSKLGKNNLILIPISSAFKEIIKKYKGKIPNYKIHSLSQFNSELRQICKQAGITDTHYTRRVVAGVESTLEQQKWELISSHTCRRTFCTLKFLDGMPAMAIMKFSGHKTERNFMRYLRLDAQLNAEHYKAFFH
jgi:integrase